MDHVNGLVQERRNSIASALELRLFALTDRCVLDKLNLLIHTKKTYFALTGELWGVYCKDFLGN